MVNVFLDIFDNYRRIIRYGTYSAMVTIVDVLIVLLLRSISIDIVIANSCGVIAGFLIHYLLSIKKVFGMEPGFNVFSVYLSTFIFGLLLADFIIWFFYEIEKCGFLISKGASIVIPFFVMYTVRKTVYGYIASERGL